MFATLWERSPHHPVPKTGAFACTIWELFEDEMAQIWTVMESYQNHWRLIWLDRLDRRGLIHVNEQAHVVFSAIKEVKLKQMMMYNCIGQNLLSTCPRRLQKTTKDDYWKWITIIGHSFCKTLHGTMVSTCAKKITKWHWKEVFTFKSDVTCIQVLCMKLPYKANMNLQVNVLPVNGLWPQQLSVTSLHTLLTMLESSNKTDANSDWHSLLHFYAGTALH